MRPVSQLPAETCRAIRFLLTDIDDTITEQGKLPSDSYRALWLLHQAGIGVIPVTGRPAGWCDLIARQWPVAGVVGENGAFAFWMDGDRRCSLYHPSAPDPLANRKRLESIAEEVFRAVPGSRAAKDQFSRLFDIAVDFREEPPFLGLDEARKIKSIFESHGARSKISSIHVNSWFGDYDKLSMTRLFLSHQFELDTADPSQNASVVFCGDSPNDEPMFQAFSNSIGVSNIREYAQELTHLPSYVTTAKAAKGFVEAVDRMLKLRGHCM